MAQWLSSLMHFNRSSQPVVCVPLEVRKGPVRGTGKSS
ncbi:Glycerol-3-phosphate acyltransferase 1, mitochondrial, partial [Araneus ventricosus]